jgi:hypothetical protein
MPLLIQTFQRPLQNTLLLCLLCCSVSIFTRSHLVTVTHKGDSSALVPTSLPAGYHLTTHGRKWLMASLPITNCSTVSWTQQQKNCGKQYFPCGLYWGYIMEASQQRSTFPCEGEIISTVALRVVRGDRKGTQCPGAYLGHPVPGGYKYRDLALQVGGVLRIGTIKYCLESRGTQTRAGQCWRGPAPTVNYKPVL